MTHRAWCRFGAAALVFAVACAHRPEQASGAAARAATDHRPYLARRAAHRTKLLRLAPATATWTDEEAPAGARRIEYASGTLSLWGWYATPEAAQAARHPALVYFHGGLALTRKEFEHCRRFRDAGFVVFTPTLRGRNGNPGNFELVYGEVDDALAAVGWVAARPEVDASRIYTFGHSMGGATSAMLSLYPDAPVRLTGSAGGIHAPDTFVRWSRATATRDLVRFDAGDREELELRVLLPHAREIAHQHVAYLGREETSFLRNAHAAAADARAAGKRFDVVEVAGDHMTALDPALDAFLSLVRADAACPASPEPRARGKRLLCEEHRKKRAAGH